ncbi:hypothetical protein PIB30_001913 [Stylosanthes scabra]|uniref:Uncharacterized protein n=1 Tax=Stylosanthes scabra TaxID=79078 RepID=A0ABU6X2W1_9FABA|nr:hypothetical protein [Stylosanthes scabra]
MDPIRGYLTRPHLVGSGCQPYPQGWERSGLACGTPPPVAASASPTASSRLGLTKPRRRSGSSAALVAAFPHRRSRSCRCPRLSPPRPSWIEAVAASSVEAIDALAHRSRRPCPSRFKVAVLKSHPASSNGGLAS